MKYITTAVLSLPAGVLLGLSVAQVAHRQHVLTNAPGRKGWYVATSPVQFKRGETLQVDGDLPKALADRLDAEDRAAKAKAKAEIEAVAKEAPASDAPATLGNSEQPSK